MKVTILSMIISNVATPPERAASFKAELRNSFSSNDYGYAWGFLPWMPLIFVYNLPLCLPPPGCTFK